MQPTRGLTNPIDHRSSRNSLKPPPPGLIPQDPYHGINYALYDSCGSVVYRHVAPRIKQFPHRAYTAGDRRVKRRPYEATPARQSPFRAST